MYQKLRNLYLLFYLSILCKNNQDVIHYIYNFIKNDHLNQLNYNQSFHVCLAFYNHVITSNYVKKIDNDFYYISPFKQSSHHFWKPIKLFSMNDSIHFKFYHIITYYPITINQHLFKQPSCSSNHIIKKIVLKSLHLKKFIQIKHNDIYYQPSLKQKIKSINTIIKRNISYFEMIYFEFINYDLYDCIILNNDGSINSILGGTIDF